jgi:SAM-dependent methyltransferase
VTATAWDTLHRQARHRLEYPSENVVRFLAGIERDPDDRRQPTALDIGCGSGRHTILLDQFGFKASACDVSADAVRLTRMVAALPSKRVLQAPMTALPYADGSFDVALAYGVFYYGTRDEHEAAVAEMHRVLRPGGRGFVCVRTSSDWRHLNPPGRDEPEHGMAVDFLARYQVPIVYARFPDVTYELSETTTAARTRTNSDWLITVTK